jgi:hypothetical protein
MNKLIAISLAMAFMVTAAFAAHVGDSVSSFVGAEARVSVPQGVQPVAVTHIVLESGVWEVGGAINFLSLHTPVGTMFIAGNISQTVNFAGLVEGAAISAEQVARLGNIIRPMSLVPRTLDVPDGTSVYLIAASFNPNPDVTAWGFINATKIRNHVD